MAEDAAVKELWGVEFQVVPDGLAEDQVVSFVNDLMEKARDVGGDQGRQASLLKLAEQTVVEADRIAEDIKAKARQEAEEAGAKELTARRAEAEQEAERIVREAKSEADRSLRDTIAEAEEQASEIVADARKEAQDITKAARDLVPGIASEAKLEAEYIVRRFTVQFVERIRSVVTDTANEMLPSLDDLMRDTGHKGILDEAEPAKSESEQKGKGRSSSKR